MIKPFAFLRWIGGKISMNENPDVPDVIVIGASIKSAKGSAKIT